MIIDFNDAFKVADGAYTTAPSVKVFEDGVALGTIYITNQALDAMTRGRIKRIQTKVDSLLLQP